MEAEAIQRPSGETATEAIPILLRVRITRQAISPRLAIKTFVNILLSSCSGFRAVPFGYLLQVVQQQVGSRTPERQ